MKKQLLSLLLAALTLMPFIPVETLADETGADSQYVVNVTSDIEEKLTTEKKAIPVGETITVKAMFSSQTTQFYNAYDLKFSYDTGTLRFAGGTSPNNEAQITDSGGVIRIKGFGADKPVSTPAAELIFEVTGKGKADVQLAAVLVDTGANAEQDVSAGTIEEDTAEADVSGYKVVLDGNAVSTSMAVVEDGEDVDFKLTKEPYYDYKIQVKVGGKDVTTKVAYDKDTGTYIIPHDLVNSKIEIFANQTPKTFKARLTGEDISGEETASYNVPYTFKLHRQKGFWYTVNVTVGGKEYYGYSLEDDVYTIPGPDITGDIAITVLKEEDTSGKVTVTFAGAGYKDGSGHKFTDPYVEYPFKLKKKNGYTYSLTVYVNGKRTPYDYDSNLDQYYILSENVTGNIVIVVGRVATIEAHEYLTMDKKVLYLIQFNGHVNEDEIPKYDGKNMYWSERYKAYIWLVTSADTVKRVKKNAEEKITLNAGKDRRSVDYSGNVNGDLRVNEADAQLVRKIYQGEYTLETLDLQQFLNADVYADRKINIRDVQAVVKLMNQQRGVG